MSFRSRPSRSGGGPPAWLVFLVAVAFVFGAYYVYQGAQNFIRTGGLGVEEATARAQVVSTATSQQATRFATSAPMTPRPTFTPIPECQDFRVIVPNAIVREGPSESSRLLGGLNAGSIVCVLGREEGSDWYSIDRNPETQRVELAYMNEVVIEAVNPTLTPSRTPSPLPTVTTAPTDTPSITPLPSETPTPSRTPRATRAGEVTVEPPTETPTLAPTEPPIQSA